MTEKQWGPEMDGLAISVYVARPAYSTAEQIDLHLDLKNSGSLPVILVRQSAWADYSLVMWTQNGAELPPTPYVQDRIEAAMEGRQATGELQSGQMTEDTLELDRAYHLSVPGRYMIRVTRKVFRPGNYREMVILTSNELIIELVERVALR
jgi:hypothetical protein